MSDNLNIICPHCQQLHGVYEVEGSGGRRTFNYNCNRHEVFGRDESNRVTKKTTTKVHHIDDNFRHLVQWKEGRDSFIDYSLPKHYSPSRRKELQNKAQLEMLPLLRKEAHHD